MSKVTITDIAKEAHVSLGTVSNVLNHRGNVKVDTIRKVEQAAAKLNYVRDTTALAIRQKNSTQVALVMPRLNDNTNDLYANLYHELKI
jgi:Transcriptional regulators